jgi:hypothetical protein
MAMLGGRIPSESDSIQCFFHFAPDCFRSTNRNGLPADAKPLASKRAVLAITKMSIAFPCRWGRKSLIHLKKKVIELLQYLLGVLETNAAP